MQHHARLTLLERHGTSPAVGSQPRHDGPAPRVGQGHAPRQRIAGGGWPRETEDQLERKSEVPVTTHRKHPKAQNIEPEEHLDRTMIERRLEDFESWENPSVSIHGEHERHTIGLDGTRLHGADQGAPPAGGLEDQLLDHLWRK